VSQETSDLIVKIDPKGRLLSVNESFCRHFSEKGFDASELKNFTDFVHPDSQQETSEKIEILRSNKTKEENLEFKHVTEDGETIAVAWHIKAKFDQRGTLKQFVSIGRIT
jgi:PAS domain S-box-containing protein